MENEMLISNNDVIIFNHETNYNCSRFNEFGLKTAIKINYNIFLSNENKLDNFKQFLN